MHPMHPSWPSAVEARRFHSLLGLMEFQILPETAAARTRRRGAEKSGSSSCEGVHRDPQNVCALVCVCVCVWKCSFVCQDKK